MGGFLVIVIIVMVRNPPMIMMTIWSSWQWFSHDVAARLDDILRNLRFEDVRSKQEKEDL